jgi:hypothetical protein
VSVVSGASVAGLAVGPLRMATKAKIALSSGVFDTFTLCNLVGVTGSAVPLVLTLFLLAAVYFLLRSSRLGSEGELALVMAVSLITFFHIHYDFVVLIPLLILVWGCIGNEKIAGFGWLRLASVFAVLLLLPVYPSFAHLDKIWITRSLAAACLPSMILGILRLGKSTIPRGCARAHS